VCDTRSMAPKLLSAVIDSCIVFDGRIVVNSKFQTTDPAIFSIGGAAKYGAEIVERIRSGTLSNAGSGMPSSNALELLPFDVYAPRELGVAVGESMLREIELIYGPPQDGEEEVLASFNHTVSEGILLPGGWHYFHAFAPSVLEPKSVLFDSVAGETGATGAGAQTAAVELLHQATSGQDMTTPLKVSTVHQGLPQIKDRHMSIHLDAMGNIQSIVYLTRQPPESRNLRSLVGLHEQLCNRMVQRMEAHMIPDLVGYFRQPWAMALFHDRFRDYLADARQVFNELYGDSLRTQLEREFRDHDTLTQLPPKTLIALRQKLPENVRIEVEQSLLRYAQENARELPVYMTIQ
jgi:cilia- and flagella-associated protein 61